MLTLWDATVLDLRLDDLDGVILQVEVDLALPDAVLLPHLVHGLLEEGVKLQHLLVEGHPGRGRVALALGDAARLGLGLLSQEFIPADARLVLPDQHGDLIAVVKVLRLVELFPPQLKEKWEIRNM